MSTRLFCKVKGCLYSHTSQAAMDAHVRFIHEGADPIVEQPKRTPEVMKAAAQAGVIPAEDILAKVTPTSQDGIDGYVEHVLEPLVTIARAREMTGLDPEPYPTREAWMLAGVDAMRGWLPAEVPEVSVSIGWPGGRGNKQHVVGQCWAAEATADRKPAIFVSPVHETPEDVLETLLHEMIHATGARGHRGAFVKLAKEVEFTAPWKSTPASPELKERLATLARALGPFPHAKVRGEGGLLGIGPERPPVQSTRMIKVWCGECGYTLRTTRTWLNVAIPECPSGHGTMEVQQ